MNNKIHPNQSTSCHRAVGSAIYCPQVRCPARTEGTRRQAGTFLLPGKGAQAPRARAERRPPPQRRVLAHGHFGQTTGTSWLGSGSRSCSKPPPRDLGAPPKVSVSQSRPPSRPLRSTLDRSRRRGRRPAPPGRGGPRERVGRGAPAGHAVAPAPRWQGRGPRGASRLGRRRSRPLPHRVEPPLTGSHLGRLRAAAAPLLSRGRRVAPSTDSGLAVGRAAPAVPAGLALRPAPGAAAARRPARPASLSRSAPAAAAAAGARSSWPRACAGRRRTRTRVRAEVSPPNTPARPPARAPPLGRGPAARCRRQRAPRAGPLGSPWPGARPRRSVGEERGTGRERLWHKGDAGVLKPAPASLSSRPWLRGGLGGGLNFLPEAQTGEYGSQPINQRPLAPFAERGLGRAPEASLASQTLPNIWPSQTWKEAMCVRCLQPRPCAEWADGGWVPYQKVSF